ncbi:hypothetical protein [Lelliottia nimipressuralis]|uniref:Uncharacterized protein n=1 Tax=Lelliottia nimipressuralis TaxID=69220 RepID=A0ABD4KG22_9ENTR|nr:hypothetical protein [Lelliottia nimipressuralis]MBF4180589.1 hypothetical protein [Lelliottia nimipressuralis]
MNINQQFDQLFAQYNQRASEILSSSSTAGTTAENDPIKFEWARQEGYQPEFDPNANQMIWTKPPEPHYNVPDLMKFRGSMSPETMAKTYPMFGLKTEHLDDSLKDIYQNVLDGKITQQYGEELVYQFMTDAYKEAKKLGKPKGAGAKSSSYQQTAENAMKGNKIVEIKK